MSLKLIKITIIAFLISVFIILISLYCYNKFHKEEKQYRGTFIDNDCYYTLKVV